MKKQKIKKLLIKDILKKIAPRIGASIVMEPEWDVAGKIIFKNGHTCYFKGQSLDLNPQGSSEIARDKDYANYFMRDLGYPVIPGRTFFSDQWCHAIGSDRNTRAAYRYAKQIGFPVIVKPNSGSQGMGVALVHNKKDFYRAMRHIFEWDDVALVQRLIKGNDYRVVVVDNKLISAYRRIPLNIVGNGILTIRSLLKKKQKQFVVSGRDTRIDMKDPRIAEKLKQQGLSWRSVPQAGQKVFLLDNANLSSGGEAEDTTNTIHKDFRAIAIRLTRQMGLRLCGVDLMIDGDITKKPERYWIIEINSAPGLDHYANTGTKQERIVEDMYLEILKAMEHRKK
jgi:D-alanine-D-alanine ligase-like ATP-grasp enzyme